MKTEISAGYITLILEDNDFKSIDWRGFIQDMKNQIPRSDLEYDGVHKVWHIVDCPYNEGVLNEMYNKYCKDERQGELF